MQPTEEMQGITRCCDVFTTPGTASAYGTQSPSMRRDLQPNLSTSNCHNEYFANP